MRADRLRKAIWGAGSPYDGVPRLRRFVHPQPLPPLPLALPRRRKGVVRTALLHAGQHVRGAHRLDVRRLSAAGSVEPPASSRRRRCRSRSWCAARRSTPPPSCTHAACGAISPQREGQPQISHKLRDKAPSNARKRRLSNLGARPLSGRVPPLSDLLHSSFTYINLCQPSETLYKSITAQTSSS